MHDDCLREQIYRVALARAADRLSRGSDRGALEELEALKDALRARTASDPERGARASDEVVKEARPRG
jgi:hypothetical protein